jgi:hypothetical protein
VEIFSKAFLIHLLAAPIPVLLEIVSLKVCLVSKETSFLILNSILDSETLLIIS